MHETLLGYVRYLHLVVCIERWESKLMSWQIEDEGNVRNKKRIFILKFVFLESDRIVNKFFLLKHSSIA